MQKCVVSNSSSNTRFTRPDVIYHTYTNITQSNDVEMDNNAYLPTEQNNLSYTTQSHDVETSSNGFLPGKQTCLSYTTQSNDVETGTNVLLPREKNSLSYTNITQSNDVEMDNNAFLPTERNNLSYTTQSHDVETSSNGFLPRKQTCLSYTSQSNDVETSTNVLLPREKNSLREVQNTVIKNFKSPRRSCRKIKLTTTNEDMSYENMPRLQTERFERPYDLTKRIDFIANEENQTVSDRVVVPVLTTTKDHTLGNGPRCSVKNCLNRYSKDLSFFGYPSDFALRKTWIEKCGLQVDPTQKLKSNVRVCRAHFDDDCFLNFQRKNRLRPDAIPTLFLDNDVIDERNIPSTSSAVNSRFTSINKPSPVNNGFIRANKPSCSSTNYVANIDSNNTPLFVYIDSTTRSAKDFSSYCSVPGCKTNSSIEEVEDISLFAPAEELVNQWSLSLGMELTTNSIVCERHFNSNDIFRPKLLVNDVDSELKSLASVALPVPVMNAVPESRTYCSMPECATNTLEEVEDISFFTPPDEEVVNEWSLSAGFDLTTNSTVCEKHFRPEDLLSNGLNSKGKSLAPFALPVILVSMEDVTTKTYCSVPGCITNIIDEVEDICLFAPTDELIDKWSSLLDLPLTLDSIVCERHFRPHDMLQPTVKEQDDKYGKIKSLVPLSMPLPRNAGLSASNATPFIQQLETNDVPVLRTYDVKFKRHKPNELDKSLSTTDKMFSSKNENKELTAVTNVTHEYNTTPDLDPTFKSHTVNSIKLKIEPHDDDLETEPEQLLPTLGTELVEDNDLLPLPSINDSLSLSLKQLKNISANSSMSITLEPIVNSKITEPSVDLFSKVSPKNSVSITLRQKHNLSSTTNNSSPSISLTPCLPSTSSTSVYNTSQQSLSQYKQKETSTKKMPDKLSSNTVEIKMPVISKCVSLAAQSHPHDSNSCIVIDDDDDDDDDNYDNYDNYDDDDYYDDDDDTEELFVEKDKGFIYEISKSIRLPTVHWKYEHDRSRNSTVFYEADDTFKFLKNITFDNSLLPKIQIYGLKYKYNKPVRTKNELQNLIYKIDFIQKCYGFDYVIHENCIGYYDNSTEDVISCSACQEKFQELQKIAESKIKTTKSLEQKISERTARVLKLRENMENNKINPTPTELVASRPFNLINSMSVCRR